LVLRSIGNENPLIRILCYNGKQASCNDILFSRSSKITVWLSWAEVGLFYFAGSSLVILFFPENQILVRVLALFSLLSMPYFIYSLWYQAFIFKKWCILCCLVQLILFLEFLAFTPYRFESIRSIRLIDLYDLTRCFIIPIAFWAFLKPFLLRSNELKSIRNTLSRLKNNDQLFRTALSEQRFYSLPEETYSIILGNSRPSNIITVVSNPYCNPCSKAHEALDNCLRTRSDLQLRIIFTNSGKNNEINRHLIALTKKQDGNLIKTALNDWFKQNTKNYKSWSKKYPLEFDAEQCESELEQQINWCKSVNVRFTPLVIINGHELPENYQIEDLKYLI
jgi:uncharacterized membrane protein